MSSCEKSNIIFDTTTLEKIINDPQWVLDNEETFWADYRAQILVRKWAEQVNFDIPYQEWREKIQDWIRLSKEERNNHDLMKIFKRILSVKDEFLKKALPHNCSFLPDGVDLSVTVQFTAFVPPFAFAVEDLVIDVASKHWNGNPEHVLNLLVHEIFHVGYSYYRTQQNEKGSVDESLYKIFDNIANEGICTYVGHRALPIFPVENERDYLLIDNNEEVQRLFAETNSVLANYGQVAPEDLLKISWEKGVIGRAYYVTGAHICKVIDEKEGREKLIDVYSKGPISILQFYNLIAEDELRIDLSGLD